MEDCFKAVRNIRPINMEFGSEAIRLLWLN